MKKNLFLLGLMAAGLTMASCTSNDNNPDPEGPEKPDAEKTIPEGTADSRVTIKDNNLDVNSENIDAWTKYATAVATLLAKDASDLNEAWSVSYKEGAAYADDFKNLVSSYKSYNDCLEEIIDGCIDIAGEVGVSKIGEPRDLWESGSYTEAVYAVESWYSFHSIDDYSNNILSIRNAFNGTLDGTEAESSIATYLKANNNDLYSETKAAITAAYDAIKGMAAPFRSHIGNATVLTAMEACADLEDVLDKKVKPFFNNSTDDDEALKAIAVNYVDNVVLPTYKSLVEKNNALKDAVANLATSRTNAAFETAANAWMEARQPWETSEAFLFGPVADLGLDPNMDSWPLDVEAIKDVLESGKIEDLIKWSGDYDEEDPKIEAVQNVRGFHTLEFLLFKDGQPRTIE